MTKIKRVFFVHAIDTEGPLYESLAAKFERIKDNFNVNIKNRTTSTLNLLRQKKIKCTFYNTLNTYVFFCVLMYYL